MKKGFALITVLVVLILIAMGSAAILTSVGSFNTMKAKNVSEIKAQYLAEAGMQYALWKCRTSACATESISIDGVSVDINADALPKITVQVLYPDL